MSISPPSSTQATAHRELKPASTSISKTLLKIVFSLYLAIAILLTAIHMFTEYQGAQQRIENSLQNIEEVVYKSLSVTMWNYNTEAVASIVEGLKKNVFLEGALITMPSGEQLGFGNIEKDQGQIYGLTDEGKFSKKKLSYFSSRFFGHDFPVYYTKDDGNKENVGHMYAFSSHAKVIDSVKSGFTLIIITAIIKTMALWFIFVWAIKTKLSAPLNSLTEFMQGLNIASASYEPVDIHSKDRNELKLLEETFNKLIEEISSYQQSLWENEEKLKYLNKNLSDLVKKRTEDLDKANEFLSTKNTKLTETLMELEQAQKRLAETAHKAGMAEISSGILHNMGTVLNSVNIHGQSVRKVIRESKMDVLSRVNKEFGTDFSEFKKNIENEGKGDAVLELYHSIGPKLMEEKERMLELMAESDEKINFMMVTLKAQQKYAESDRLFENISVRELLQDSIQMVNKESDSITYSVAGDESVVYKTEKSKLLNILTNIILNARDSLVYGEISNPHVDIDFHLNDSDLEINIKDNGAGISQDRLLKIFNFGYTTRDDHDGFGLHNSANQVRELGGELKVASDMENNETVFTLLLPLSVQNQM